MSEPLRWGIIGSGGIAHALAEGAALVADARLWSVLSRQQATGDAFAARHNLPHVHTDIATFLADPLLDAVIVATPHPLHRDQTIACLQAGKHVLCEKPLALNGRDVEQMIAAAQASQCFLMEAMWMWFNPATRKARELLEAGAIGTPQILEASFGFHAAFDPASRLFNPALGGGALLDIGIYPLALALYLFGAPTALHSHAVMGRTGVDEQIAVALEYPDGRLASFNATFRAKTSCEAVIGGSAGFLRIHRNFWYAERLTLEAADAAPEILEIGLDGNGYNHEIAHATACIREGRLESPVMSWQHSRELMAMMDTLRQQWGLVYPGE